MPDVSNRIRRLRAHFGWTQEALGRAAGVSKQAVSGWERGDTAPSRDALRSLREQYGIDDEWIMRGGDRMLLGAASGAAPALPRVSDESPAPYRRKDSMHAALAGLERAAAEDRFTSRERALVLAMWEVIAERHADLARKRGR